ncbi:hypothetical protein OROHE_021239 [Orobanche hederae]
MANIIITGSASIISHSYGNPHQNSPVICETSAPNKTSVKSIPPKNISGSVSSVHNTEKTVDAGETILGKTQSAIKDALSDPVIVGQTAQPSKNDAAQPLSNTRSDDTTEDSTQKVHQDSRSGTFAGVGVTSEARSSLEADFDLGRFLFPGVSVLSSASPAPAIKISHAVFAVSGLQGKYQGSNTKSCGGVCSDAGSALESSNPKSALGDPPKTIGSNQILDVIASENGVPDNFETDPVGSNLQKGSPPVKPVCAADLRRVVSPEVWPRFPEAVWNDAAVIASEILKFPPPAGAQGMNPLVPPNIVSPDAVLTGAPVIPPVPPVVEPVTPSDPVC